MLQDYFEVLVKMEQFVGQWAVIGPENETRLGRHNSTLGTDIFCGDRIWNRQSKFRIRVGPVSLERFLKLLPSGGAFKELTQMAQLFAGMEYDFDVHLVLKANEVPACQLRSEKQQACLGWSAWLKTVEFTKDSEDAVLHCNN